jgi:hypothetical protein
MRILKQSTARSIYILMTDAADHITGKAGLTLTFTLGKNGGNDSAIAPAYTDHGDGVYSVDLTSAHTDTLGDLWLHITGTDADPCDEFFDVRVGLPGETVAVESIAANAITASSIAADAVTELQAGLATSTALTDVQTDVTNILSDTGNIQTRLPAALVGGRMDSHVNVIGGGAITAAAIGTGAIDADALASDAVTEIQAGLATAVAVVDIQTDVDALATAVAGVQADTDNIQTRIPAALVSGRMDTHVGAMGAGVVTASAVATDAIDADAISASAVAEIQNGLVTSGDLSTILSTLETLEAVAIGRWRVIGDQLILYELDGTTPLVTFDLFDDSGNPSMTRIFERVPA